MKSYFKNYKKVLSILLALAFMVSMNPAAVSARMVEAENTVKNTKAEKYTQIDKEKGASFNGQDNSAMLKNNLPSKIKSKLDTNLLKLTNKQSLGLGESKESLKDKMKSSNQLVSKGDTTKFDKSSAPNDMVFVYIKTKTPEGVNKVEPYIYKVMDKDPKNKLLAAWVEVGKLEQLELLDEVFNVSIVTKPMVNITSEGDNLHRANMVRGLSNGTMGSGVKIGVISDGVDHLSESVDMGELSAQTTVVSNEVGGDEGTAMLEIIHDLAPGAQLYFHDCGNDSIAFNSAIDDLAAAGCKIIVDDIGWFDQPFFEDGIIATHIKALVDTTGINYISSAGNSAKRHYQGMYYNNGSNWHDFSSGTSNNKNIYVKVQPGQFIQTFLQWDDPFENSTNDYDLYFFNAQTGEILNGSDGVQGGNASPVEVTWYINNTSSPVDVAVAVFNQNGAAQAKNLELYVWGNCYTNNIVTSDSIFGQPAIPEVIAAGAIDVPSPNAIAVYSSQGPVTTRSGAVRKKPDICGAAGVSVTGVGGFPSTFYGTSAAAPHVAAIAALMRSRYPSKTGKEIRDLIQNTAVDLGASGLDNVFGYGRADAYNAFMAAGPGEGIAVKGVTLNKSKLTICLGYKRDLIATVNPVEASNQSITWSSSNNSIARVDVNGRVSALAKGSAIITATAVFGGYTASCEVTVTDTLQITPTRYSGASRFETAVEVSKAGWQTSENVILSNAYGFADALTGVPFAYQKDAPILLTETNSIPTATSNEIRRLGAKNVYILGGIGVVSGKIEDDLKGNGFNVFRLAGLDRFETSIKIADEVMKKNENGVAILTTAYNYPDALAISSFAAMCQDPILYTETASLNPKTREFIYNNRIRTVIIPGGTGAVSEGVVNELKSKGISVERISGADRYNTALNIGSLLREAFKNDVMIATGNDFPDALAGGVLAAKKQIPILLVDTNSVSDGVRDFIRENDNINLYILGGTGVVSDNVVNRIIH